MRGDTRTVNDAQWRKRVKCEIATLFGLSAKRVKCEIATLFGLSAKRRKLSNFTGDIFFDVRLEQWAKHNGSEAALLSEPYQRPNGTKSARYKLSATGHVIMRDGLGEIARGAPLPIWGVTAYDPLAPWVVVDEHAESQRLQLFGERSQ